MYNPEIFSQSIQLMDRAESIPMVSVVMVTYNQSNLLQRAVKGVAKQQGDYRVELILADDCSTDNTPAVVAALKKKYPGLISYYRNSSNLGVQKNYREAFRHCRGKYMAMCDADDYWCDRRKLKIQVDFLEAHTDYALCFHRVINHYAGRGTKSLSNPVQKADCDVEDLAKSNFITNCSVVYRRELVNLINLPEWMFTDCWPDYPLHLLYARHGRIHYFNRVMAVYRRGGTGAWTAVGEYERQRKALFVRDRLIEEFKDMTTVSKWLRESIRHALVSIVAYAPDYETKSEARKRLMEEFNISDSDIDTYAAMVRRGGRTMLKRILTLGRQAISLFIPLPRP